MASHQLELMALVTPLHHILMHCFCAETSGWLATNWWLAINRLLTIRQIQLISVGLYSPVWNRG